MSWRVLIIFLLLAAVASWQGGLQLGEWLLARAPESISSASSSRSNSGEQILDANGKPFAAQPPQPRIDGTLGVPHESAPVEWTVTAVIAEQFDSDHELAAGGADLLSGIQDIATLDVAGNTREQSASSTPSATGERGGSAGAVSPPRTSASLQPRTVTPAAVTLTWQQALRKDIEKCDGAGFFQRPSCVQNTRNKFCTPNNAWGKTADCPARSFEQSGGN
jgi:hypothetical protein